MALGEVMDHYAELHRLPLNSSSDVGPPVVIHRPGRAFVLIDIQCSSEAATRAANIELISPTDRHQAAVADPKPLRCKVSPGEWTVQVSFPGHEFADPPPAKYTLSPPVFQGVDLP